MRGNKMIHNYSYLDTGDFIILMRSFCKGRLLPTKLFEEALDRLEKLNTQSNPPEEEEVTNG